MEVLYSPQTEYNLFDEFIMSSQVRCDDTINLTPNTNHKKIKLTSSSNTSISPTIKENEDNENFLVKQLKGIYNI